MASLINRHSRCFQATPELVRPWIEKAWSGTDGDIFPRDFIPDWRQAGELIPGQTRLGHGPFRFRLTRWDGWSWRVEVLQGSGLGGWHGFDLEQDGPRTRLTHTLSLTGSAALVALARAFMMPIHDWAVESILDRLEEALASGQVPLMTRRPMDARSRLAWRCLNLNRVRNLHTRWLAWPPEQVQPWLQWVWSGTDQDIFPRDRMETYRRNPAGADPLALVPGVTRLGHGPARFLFGHWDARSWQARILSRRIQGRQGFLLEREGQGTRLTHLLDARLSGRALLEWPLLMAPLHDWAVEAMLDRLEAALKTGRVPPQSLRPMPALARWALGRYSP